MASDLVGQATQSRLMYLNAADEMNKKLNVSCVRELDEIGKRPDDIGRNPFEFWRSYSRVAKSAEWLSGYAVG